MCLLFWNMVMQKKESVNIFDGSDHNYYSANSSYQE
jgi:hypothetical protein